MLPVWMSFVRNIYKVDLYVEITTLVVASVLCTEHICTELNTLNAG